MQTVNGVQKNTHADPIISTETASKIRESFFTLEKVLKETREGIEFIAQISEGDYKLGRTLIDNLLTDEENLKSELERVRKVVYHLALYNIINRGNKDFFYGMVRYEAHFGIILPFMNDISLRKYPQAKGNVVFETLVQDTRKRVYRYAINVIGEFVSKLEEATKRGKNGYLILSDKEAIALFQE